MRDVIRNWREREPCWMMSGSVTKLYPIVMWKEQLVSHEFGYLAEDHFKNVLMVRLLGAHSII